MRQMLVCNEAFDYVVLAYSMHGDPCRLSLVNLLHGMIQLLSFLQDAEIYHVSLSFSRASRDSSL